MAGPEPAAATYTDDPANGAGSLVTLSSDGPSHNLTIADSVLLEGPTGILDGENTCDADPLDPSLTNPAFVCPLASQLTVDLGAGDDTVRIGDNMPILAINGGDGTDTVDFSAGTKTQDVDLVAGTADAMTLASVENVTGGPGGDTVTGDANANVEDGGGGNDALKGGDGDDTLNGGAGVNTVAGGAGVDKLTAGGGGDLLDGGDGEDTITGGGGDDYIIAADGFADTIDCGAGANDTVVADLGADVVKDTFKNCENVQGTVRITTPGDSTTTTLQPVILVPSVTPALTPVLAPGKPDFADLTPPSASMRSFTRQRLSTVVKRGVPIRVTCKEACGISIALSVDRTTARRLKLDSRSSPVVIATATAQRHNAGTSQLRVKFTKRAGAALKTSKRGVIVMTQVLVSDASGNGTLLSRRTTLVH